MQEIFFVPAQFPTIQAAVDAAAGPTTILVAPGAYDEGARVVDKEQMVIQSTRLTRRGVTLTGGEGWGVFFVERSTLHLSGIEVRSNGRLRGIWVRDSTISLQDCVVAGNRTWTQPAADGVGAGMECRFSSVRLQKSTIAGNTVDCAAGTASAAAGGGLYLESCAVVIAGCTVQANAAHSSTAARGGGIWCAGGQLRMWRSRVTDNALRAPLCEGAGLYLREPERCELGGSVVTGNGSSDGRGGGLFVAGDVARVAIHSGSVVRQNHPDDTYPAR